MKKEQYPVVVIFRKYKDSGDVLALFPYEADNDYRVMCYEHVGQHGMADYGHCMDITVPATKDEYRALKAELESIGYVLTIRLKANGRLQNQAYMDAMRGA